MTIEDALSEVVDARQNPLVGPPSVAALQGVSRVADLAPMERPVGDRPGWTQVAIWTRRRTSTPAVTLASFRVGGPGRGQQPSGRPAQADAEDCRIAAAVMLPRPLLARLTLALLVAALILGQATPSLASRAWPLNDGHQTHQRVVDRVLAELSSRSRVAAPDPIPSRHPDDRHLRLLRAEIPLALTFDLGLTPVRQVGFLSTFTYDPPPRPRTCVVDRPTDAPGRDYDPGDASWLCVDPLGAVDSPNLYQAFGLDPQNNTDPLGLAEFLKPTTTSVDATYTTCIKSRPQGDVSVPCVDIPGGKVTVEGFTAATDTPDYLRALHRVGVSDEDASAMVARNAPDSAPIAGTALGAAAQGATQAGTVAKPAFHLTMAFVSATGPSILAASRAMPAAYLSGLGQTGARLFEFANYDNIVSSGMKNQWKPGAPSRGSPAHLTAGRAWENAELASLGKPKNTTVWRPSQADIESSAFKVIVGPAKYTSGGRPVGTIVDIVETGGSIEIKGGTKMLESSYQLRLQTYRALQLRSPLTIRTTRPINPEFSAWLERWGVAVENPALPGSLP